MPAKDESAKHKLFADLGKLFYDWRKVDPIGLVYEREAEGCDMEIERLVELIDYVQNKKAAVKRK